MFNSIQVEFLLLRGIDQQRGRGFGAPSQAFVRSANPLYFVPAAKRVSAELLDFD